MDDRAEELSFKDQSYGVGVVADPYPELAERRAHGGTHTGAFSAWFGINGPEQVVYASDYPYGQQPASLLIALRTARLAQLDDEQVRGVLAGNANRIANGEPPVEPSAPKGTDTFSQPIALARIHQYLSMATPLLWTRQQDHVGVLGLALNACDDRANGHRGELDQIRELLIAAQAMWLTLPEDGDERDRMAHTRATFRLIHLADIVAVTTPA